MADAITRTLRANTQRDQTPGRTDEVRNDAGGYVFQLDPHDQVLRWLILGTDGGTYYVNEKPHTERALNMLIEAMSPEIVNLAVEVSEASRAARNDQAIFTLAAAARYGDDATRSAAYNAIRDGKVLRIGTHLFLFAHYTRVLGKTWSRGLRTAIQDRLNAWPAEDLAYQMIKYRQRHGHTWRDILRRAKPVPVDAEHEALYRWATKPDVDLKLPERVGAFERLQSTQDKWAVLTTISAHRMPWEAVPDRWKDDPLVWETLLGHMPLGAVVRQLPTLSRVGVLKPLSAAEKYIVDTLTDAKAIKRSRLHPMRFLTAAAVYGADVGDLLHRYGQRRHRQDYTPSEAVAEALERAFHLSFGNIEPAGSRTYLALDVSPSMGGSSLSGCEHLSCAAGAAAMAAVTAAIEPRTHIAAFAGEMVPVRIRPHDSITKTMNKLSDPNWGRTDCAQPMIDARRKRLDVDTFVIYTDNETWSGRVKPYRALLDYRRASGIQARLVVVAMTATPFTIAEPGDAGMLDVVGFDADTPRFVSEFSAGRL